MAKIEWKGGECPVGVDTKVRVFFRSGHIAVDYAGNYSWDHLLYSGDIIAYEVIEEEPINEPVIQKTLRDEFAIAWLVNFAANMKINDVADECYRVADAMMKARAK